MITNFEKKFGPYIPPTETTKAKYATIQKKVYELAALIQEECPESEEKNYAFLLLKQARMAANESIAIHS